MRATVTPGLYGSTTTYQVVSAGSLAGAFASVQVSSPFFNSTMAYNATSANLVLTRIPFNQLSTGGSNGRAIGNVLEANYSTNLTGTLASFYGNLLASSAPNTLSQLTGEVATAPQTASFAVFSQFFGTIFGQTASSRALGGAAAGLGDSRQTALRTTTPGGGTRVSLDGNETCSSEVCDTRRAPHRYTAWAQGFGGAGSVDGSGSVGSSRLDMNSGGGATGIDVRLDPDTLVGFTLGDGIGCPAGTPVLDGGAQDPDHVAVVQVGGSIDEGASAWAIDVNNSGQSVHQVNGYAICAA